MTSSVIIRFASGYLLALGSKTKTHVAITFINFCSSCIVFDVLCDLMFTAADSAAVCSTPGGKAGTFENTD